MDVFAQLEVKPKRVGGYQVPMESTPVVQLLLLFVVTFGVAVKKTMAERLCKRDHRATNGVGASVKPRGPQMAKGQHAFSTTASSRNSGVANKWLD